MHNKSIINNFFKIGIKSWLKFVCTSIDIHSHKLNANKKYFGNLDEICLEAKNIIYKD